MYLDAEKNGPALSSENDTGLLRLESFLDDLDWMNSHSSINVVIGDMSLSWP